MDRPQSQAILHDLLRSFTTLAKTLNLSQAVRELNSTRQTVRRHISILEEARGEKLFELRDRQYVLTEAGKRALPEAEVLLSRGQAWLEARIGHVNGLSHFNFENDDGYFYCLQQHPISRLWTGESELLRQAVQAWSRAEGRIEDDAFLDLRDNTLIFRPVDGRWLCTEVGPDSAFARWFGWAWAKSTVGRPVDALPGGGRFNIIAAQSYEEMRLTHGLRLDHVVTRMPFGQENVMKTIGFERILLGCRYPDESFALVSVVHLTRNLDVIGLTDARRESIYLAGEQRLCAG